LITRIDRTEINKQRPDPVASAPMNAAVIECPGSVSVRLSVESRDMTLSRGPFPRPETGTFAFLIRKPAALTLLTEVCCAVALRTRIDRTEINKQRPDPVASAPMNAAVIECPGSVSVRLSVESRDMTLSRGPFPRPETGTFAFLIRKPEELILLTEVCCSVALR